MVMPDMKKGLPYTFKTYKVDQSSSKCHLLTQSSLTSNKNRMNAAWHLSIQGCGRAHLWAIHPSAIGGGRSHYVSMICIPGATVPEWFVFRCQNMSASSPTTVLARRPKRDNLLTANHFKWCSQYHCHKTANLYQIMLISTEECNCLSSALFQLLSELSSYIDTRF